MKTSYKPKAINLLSKFDKQLRDILMGELKSAKMQFVNRLRHDNNGMMVA